MTRSFSRLDGARALLAGALLLTGCIVRAGEPRPLYPNPEQPRDPGQVARLLGPVGNIDGTDVSRMGKSFALAPGCHFVKLPKKVADASSTVREGLVAYYPDWTYALKMKAGHAYEVDVRVDNNTGPTPILAVQMWERDLGAGRTPIAPASSDDEIEACRSWTP
jgi:hypothetical protein